MKTKPSFIFGISLLLLVSTVIVCSSEKHYCRSFDNFSIFLTLFSFSFLVMSTILFFLREQIFNSWKNFALWWLPISAFFIAITPGQESGHLGSFGMGMDRESVTWFFSALFFLISLILIVYKSLKLRGQK